jgi:hypothetical protein
VAALNRWLGILMLDTRFPRLVERHPGVHEFVLECNKPTPRPPPDDDRARMLGNP